MQSQTSLCDIETITYLSDDDNVYCPTPGSYQLYWSYTVPKAGGSGDPQLQYTPDIRLKFTAQTVDGSSSSSSSSTTTTLGCAGTGTVATVQQTELNIRDGEIALGIALVALFGIFGCCLCMAYRRKKQVEQELSGDTAPFARKRFYFARNSGTGEIIPRNENVGCDNNNYNNNNNNNNNNHHHHYKTQQAKASKGSKP